MRIGELSRRTGVSRDALRLYEDKGLIRADRRDNGYRDYDAATERLVSMIRLGQRLGFSLAEIAVITKAMADDSLGADETEVILRTKMGEVEARISGLTALKGILAEAIRTVCPLRAR